MTIQYASDLHLEFEINSFYLQQNPLPPVADVLVLAGDITYLREDFYRHRFFDYVSEHWEKVFWLPGNHEFYCGIDMNLYNFSKAVPIRNNVFLVNDITIELNDISLIFSTLWSEIEEKFARLIERNVSDFECIVRDGKKLSSEEFNRLHYNSLEFIKKESIRLKNEKKVIVTHHLPSNLCNATEFLGSKINSVFCTELTDFVEECGANYWIFGHSHRNIPGFTIGKTKMLTNQLGYIQLDEQNGFKPDAVLSI